MVSVQKGGEGGCAWSRRMVRLWCVDNLPHRVDAVEGGGGRLGIERWVGLVPHHVGLSHQLERDRAELGHGDPLDGRRIAPAEEPGHGRGGGGPAGGGGQGLW